MKEIEVKAYLRDKGKVMEKLSSLGCVLSQPVRQIDTVYTNIPAETVDEYFRNDHFLRIREQNDGRFIFTVKKPLSREVQTKLEHETEVKDAVELEQAILLMGYKVANKVIKVRRTAHLKDFEICIDEVEELGTFIEVERMSDGDVDAVRNELNEFLALLGVSSGDQVHKGYDIMMIEKQG